MAKGANIPPFGNEEANPFKQSNPFNQFKLPDGAMETFLSNYQKNMELVTSAQQLAADSTKSILDRQNEYCKNAFDQWNEHIKFCCSKAPLEEKTAHHAEVSKEALDKTGKHLRDVNSIIVKAHEKIAESVQKRLKESLDESLNVAKKSAEKR